MSNLFHNELKKEFQLERMILFSDAVFAIAITLLALEIKVPEIERAHFSDHLLWERMLELTPKFIGFLVSFLVIGIYWVAHHRMFGYVINYTPQLLWLNLFFLLAIVLMPFSSGIYSSYIIGNAKLPVSIYALNITFLATMSLIIWRYITSTKRGLTQGVTPEIKKYITYRAMVPLVVFALTALTYIFIAAAIAIWMPLLIPVGLRLLRRKFLIPQKIKK